MPTVALEIVGVVVDAVPPVAVVYLLFVCMCVCMCMRARACLLHESV